MDVNIYFLGVVSSSPSVWFLEKASLKCTTVFIEMFLMWRYSVHFVGSRANFVQVELNEVK